MSIRTNCLWTPIPDKEKNNTYVYGNEKINFLESRFFRLFSNHNTETTKVFRK